MAGSALPVDSVTWHVVKVATPYRYSGREDLDVLPGTDYYVEYGWDQVYSRQLETLLVEVESGGRVGWGEAQAPIVPEGPATLIDRLYGPMVLGRDARRVEAIRDRLYASMNIRGHVGGFAVDAISGLETALWDLLGRARGEPVSALLGSRRRDRLPAYVSLPGFDTTEQVEQARAFVDDGFAGVKAFGGTGIDEDVATVTAIRDAVGADPAVMIDAFWSYDASEAIRLGEALRDADPAFIEAPLAPEDPGGHARVARALSTPVAVGEPIRTATAFRRWLEADALDVAQPDVMRTGLTEATRIAALAGAHNRPIAPHFGSALGIGMAATWHLASTLPDLFFQEHQPRCFEAGTAFLDPGLALDSGDLLVPERPGLGVGVDRDALAEHVVDSGSVSK